MKPFPENGALSSIAYDEYISGAVLHVGDHCQTLAKFVQETEMVHQASSTKQKEKIGLITFPGERDPAIVIATEGSKKVARTLLKGLWDSERKGICFEKFGWDNIVVTRSGKARFRNVNTIRHLVGQELADELRSNYTWAHDIIKRMYGPDPPDDIGDLLDLMENHFEDRDFFHLHPSLIPLVKYQGLFKEVYDYVLSMLPKPLLYDLLDDLRTGLPSYVNHWRNIISSNELLMISYRYNESRSYILPVNKPDQTKLSKDQKSMLTHLGIGFDGKTTLTPRDLELILPLQFLIFLRNRPAHCMEPYERYCKDNPGKRYNREGSERVSHGRFARILGWLLCWLKAKGLLGNIMLSELF